MTDISNDISVRSLNELESAGSNNLQRIHALQHAFQKEFDIQPEFICNVPGR